LKFKTLAVMQPYIFPYIGYFNLLNSCDVFVLYDDVNFIKQGWINRNRVLNSKNEVMFSVPLVNQSSNLAINEVTVANYERFKVKFLRTIEQCYSKAIHFEVGLDYVTEVLNTEFTSISELASSSIEVAKERLNLQCEILTSSEQFAHTKGMERSQRLIAMAQILGCNRYVNSVNGSFLYDKNEFSNNGVELKFIKPTLLPYRQCNAREFHAGLSIIDLMMNLSVEEIRTHLDSFELV